MDNKFNGQDDNSGIFGGYNGGNNNSSFGNDYNNSGYNNNFGNDYNNNGYNNNFGNDYNNNGYNNNFVNDYNNSGYNNNFVNDYNNSGYNNNFGNDYNNSGYNNNFGNDYNNNGYNNNFGNDYNNNGYNNNYGNNYNNSGKSDPNIPDYIYAAHPDARMATKKDGIRQLVIVSIVSFIVLILCGALFFYTLSSMMETERIMGNNVTVQGVVTRTWKTRSGGRHKTTTYHASYRYTYNDEEYTGTTRCSSGTYKGEILTIYIDPERPWVSRTSHENVFPLFIIAGGVIVLVILIFNSVKTYKLCCKGRMVIYKRKSTNGYRTVWKKIK